MRLKIISLVLALCAWGYLRFAANPLLPSAGDRHVTLPIGISGLHQGTSVHFDEQSVAITLDTPLDTAAIAAGAVSAGVDLSQVPLGRHLVPVVVRSNTVAVTDLHPATVFITITQGSQP